MWHARSRCGLQVGREQTTRPLRLAGVSSKRKGGPIADHHSKGKMEDTRPDSAHREFRAPEPNRRRVADTPYVHTRAGFVYTTFATDMFSRKIVGWALSNSMRTEALPLHALNQCDHQRKKDYGAGSSFGSRIAVRQHYV